jgi:hypothetical protein
LDPASGKTYWRQRLRSSGGYVVSTPVFHKDRLLVGGLMFQLDPDKPAAKVLWPASNAPSQRILSHTSTALFRGGHLFSAKSSGELICLEASTGKQVWESAKVTDLKNGASIHLTVNGDSVLLYTDKGELIRAQLTSQGYKEISRVAVLEPTLPFGGRKVAWSPPAYANRHIFARNGKELICASLAGSHEASLREPGNRRANAEPAAAAAPRSTTPFWRNSSPTRRRPRGRRSPQCLQTYLGGRKPATVCGAFLASFTYRNRRSTRLRRGHVGRRCGGSCCCGRPSLPGTCRKGKGSFRSALTLRGSCLAVGSVTFQDVRRVLLKRLPRARHVRFNADLQ